MVCFGCCLICCCVSSEIVGLEFVVKVDFDGVDVGGVDRDVVEEFLVLVVEKYDVFVEGEEVGEGVLEIGWDVVEFVCEMVMLFDNLVGGGVEVVVVFWGEVDDGVVEGGGFVVGEYVVLWLFIKG